jgi:hypothetical protein
MQMLLKKALTDKSARNSEILSSKLVSVGPEMFDPWQG